VGTEQPTTPDNKQGHKEDLNEHKHADNHQSLEQRKLTYDADGRRDAGAKGDRSGGRRQKRYSARTLDGHTEDVHLLVSE